MNPKILNISSKAIEFIKDWEKFNPNVYNDSEDYCSIGYGHLIKKQKCEFINIPEEFKNGITKDKATALFAERLKTFENSIKRDIKVNLFQHEYDALVSLVFNNGAFFFKYRHTKKNRNPN